MKNNENNQRIEQLISWRAKQVPDLVALSECGHDLQWLQVTFAELISQACELSEWLVVNGVEPGDRIVLVSKNTIDTIISLIALWQAKATVVFVDPGLPEIEILHQLKLADSKGVVIPMQDDDINNIFIMNTSRAFCKKGQGWTLSENKKYYSKTCNNDRDEDLAALVFTSGTTGDSRAVMLTHDSFVYLMGKFAQYSLGQVGDCSLTILPIFHVAGLVCGVLCPLYFGTSIVILSILTPESLQSAFDNKKPTIIIGVPRFLEMLNQKIMVQVASRGRFAKMVFHAMLSTTYFFERFLKFPLGKTVFKSIHQQLGGRVKKIFCGSALLSPTLQKKFLTFGFDILISYGLTETCGPITLTKYSYRWRSGSVGACINLNDFVVDDDYEVLYQGPAKMRGYFRDPEATAISIRNGWCYTQDIGKLDKAGNLYITGRKREWIVFPDGKKAMPEQIERQYRDTIGIKDYAVFSCCVNGAVLVVLAFVPENNVMTASIVKSVLQKASRLKTPYRVHKAIAVTDIPRSNTLKVKRHLLKELYLNQLSDKREDVLSQHNNQIIVQLLNCFHAFMPEKQTLVTPEVSFVELGIDSLLAVQLAEKISQQLAVPVSPTAFWFCYNIKELAEYLSKDQSAVNAVSSVNNAQDNLIAIVGVACRFPGDANNFDTYWSNLIVGKDAIIEVPRSRWDCDMYYNPYRLAPGKINTKCGGFISLPDCFNSQDFAIKSKVAEVMDPQQKWLLILAQELFSKHSRSKQSSSWVGSNTGVFIGAELSDFFTRVSKDTPLENVTSYTGIGMSDFALSSRIAYHFGLTGPSLVTKTACSSSLVSVHQAVRAIQSGDCDYAVAGGVNMILLPDVSVCLTKGGFLSPDGRCRVFDRSANGYVRSEGAGLVLLKRYHDALKDGDDILAVIAGSAINQDGASNGLTAPNGSAQVACYQSALKQAGIIPSQVNYVESHGTGTVLGDAIEMQSIQSVYDQHDRESALYVGAVKSQIGHCEAAAGIAGLIKTIGVLKHQSIPPNLHYALPNTNISFAGSKVVLPQVTTPFSCQYAAVSSFGLAGTNVHMVLRKYN